MTTTIHVIDCELGYFDLKTIKVSRSLLKAKDVKEAVRREIDWFNQPALKPNLMVTKLSPISLDCLKSMLLYNKHSKMFDGINMSPNELAIICCKRYLSGDQMLWITKKLNSMQNEVHCIYINYIRNIKRYVQRINLTPNITATKLTFIVNVGKFNNGKTYVGSDINAGYHWTLAVYHRNANTIFYSDSLGWEFPVS